MKNWLNNIIFLWIFALTVYSSKEVLTKKNECFNYRGENFVNVFTKKKGKNLYDLQIFLNKKLFLQKKARENIG